MLRTASKREFILLVGYLGVMLLIISLFAIYFSSVANFENNNALAI